MSTLLTYVLSTVPVPLHAGPDPDVSPQLTVMGTNATGNDVSLQGIEIDLLIGGDATDLTADAPVNVVPATGWQLCQTGTEKGVASYVFLPGDDCGDTSATVIVPDQASIVFIFNDVAVNDRPGTSTVKVTEGSAGNPFQALDVSKFPNGWGAVSFSANPLTVKAGQTTTLTWAGPSGATYTLDYYTNKTGAVHVPAPGQEPLGNEGSVVSAALDEDTVFYLTVEDTVDDQTYTALQALPVTVESVTILADGPSEAVDALAQAVITWTTTNAATVALEPNDPVPATSGRGQFTVYPASNTTYVLTAADSAGNRAQAEVAVDVNPPKIVSFTATPVAAAFGTPVTLMWQTKSAASVVIGPGVGSVGAGGKTQVTPGDAGVTTYTLTAQSQGAATSAISVISVPAGFHQAPVSFGLSDSTEALVFGGKLWWLDTGGTQAWFTEDGITWTQAELGTRWQAFTIGGAAVFAPVGDIPRMWVMGGFSGRGPSDSMFCTTDATGLNWKQVEASSGPFWSPRTSFGCAAFLGKLWVFGGMGVGDKLLNDVWSSPDGVTWALETEEPGWSPRATFSTTVFGNQLWLCGGTTSSSMSPTNDVYTTTDGVHWSKLDVKTTWPARRDPLLAQVGSQLWLTGGVSPKGPLLDMWSITGEPAGPFTGFEPWVRYEDDAGWPAAAASMPVACATFNGMIWYLGGTSVWYFLPPPS